MKSIAKFGFWGYTQNPMEFEALHIPPDLGNPVPRGRILEIPAKILERISREAFERMAFTFTREHLDHLVAIVEDGGNSHNDRMTASMLLENALISSKGVYPLCQDTGTAQVFAWRDSAIAVTRGDETDLLAEGAKKAYANKDLRFSTTIPSDMFSETDPNTNMPAQVLIQSTGSSQGYSGGSSDPTNDESESRYRFLFCAKGGGSSNKTSLTQGTKALLNEAALERFLEKKIAELGTSACPPYTISLVVGGISPEQNLLALKLATAGFFDEELPGWDYRVMGYKPLRSEEWEAKILAIAAKTGLGAQFGGKALAAVARVLRFPRHGASCPVSVGVSCSAHRNLHGYIDSTGVYLEKTVNNPLEVEGLESAAGWHKTASRSATLINLDEGIHKAREILSRLDCATPLLLSGKIILARDSAHARWKKLLDLGMDLPEYLKDRAIFYAGPARTPLGAVTGSLGPTTAGRMDDYAGDLMSRGVALITLAKGNRSRAWAESCKKYGGFYLGTTGGTAALFAEKNIVSSEVIDFPELGMEAVRLVTLKDLPAFLVTNSEGKDFYASILEKNTLP